MMADFPYIRIEILPAADHLVFGLGYGISHVKKGTFEINQLSAGEFSFVYPNKFD
jgi:hypothetical protein